MEFRGFEVEDDGALYVLFCARAKNPRANAPRASFSADLNHPFFSCIENREINNEEINHSAGNLYCRFSEKISRK